MKTHARILDCYGVDSARAQHILRLARSLLISLAAVACSDLLDNDRLNELIARPIDDPDEVVYMDLRKFFCT